MAICSGMTIALHSFAARYCTSPRPRALIPIRSRLLILGEAGDINRLARFFELT
jgi:hypothetical protein